MENKKIIYLSLGAFVFIVFLVVGLVFIFLPKKVDEIHDKNQLSDEKIIEYFSLHNDLLMLGFPNYGNEIDNHVLKTYEGQEERFFFLQGYFNDNDDIQDSISFHTFNTLSKQIFGKGLDYDLIGSFYKTDDQTILLDSPGEWLTLFSFWKHEYDKETETYAIYIVDFASCFENSYPDQNLLNKYSSFIKVSLEDLKNYSPSLLAIKVKRKQNNYQIVSSEYDRSYSF